MAHWIPTYKIEDVQGAEPGRLEWLYSEERLQGMRSLLRRPYRSQYYGFGLCKSGTGFLRANLETYEVKPDTVVAMSPQVIKQWLDVSDDFKMQTVFFTKSFFSHWMTHPDYLERFAFFATHAEHVQSFIRARTAGLREAMSMIRKAATSEASYSRELLPAYIHILLYRYQALYTERSKQVLPAMQTRGQQLVVGFKQLVQQHFYTERSIQFYALQLSISPRHLADVLKQETGKTASEWIQEVLILEAKILLGDLSLQVKQIADMLYFADVSSFGKYFRKHSGLSPLEYRKGL